MTDWTCSHCSESLWFLKSCEMSSVICLLCLWFWREGEGGDTEDNIFRQLWILNSLFAFSVLQKTLEQTPRDYLTSFEMFNSTYKLYTHRWGRGTWSNNILHCMILLTFKAFSHFVTPDQPYKIFASPRRPVNWNPSHLPKPRGPKILYSCPKNM